MVQWEFLRKNTTKGKGPPDWTCRADCINPINNIKDSISGLGWQLFVLDADGVPEGVCRYCGKNWSRAVFEWHFPDGDISEPCVHCTMKQWARQRWS